MSSSVLKTSFTKAQSHTKVRVQSGLCQEKPRVCPLQEAESLVRIVTFSYIDRSHRCCKQLQTRSWQIIQGPSAFCTKRQWFLGALLQLFSSSPHFCSLHATSSVSSSTFECRPSLVSSRRSEVWSRIGCVRIDGFDADVPSTENMQP